MAGTNPPDPWTESSNLQSETLAFRERNGQWIDLAGIGGTGTGIGICFSLEMFCSFRSRISLGISGGNNGKHIVVRS